MAFLVFQLNAETLFGDEFGYLEKIEIRGNFENEWTTLEMAEKATWNSSGIGDIVWFRFYFSPSNKPIKEKLAFSPGTVSSSFELIHDGKVIGKKGEIRRFAGMPWTGRFEVFELPETFLKNGPEILEMRIQSFSLVGGFIGDQPRIGGLNDLSAVQLQRNWKPSLVFVGVLVLFSCVFFLSLLVVSRLAPDLLGLAFLGAVFSEMCDVFARAAILFDWPASLQIFLTTLTTLFWGFLSYPFWLIIISRLVDFSISRRLKNYFFVSLGMGLVIAIIGFHDSNSLYFSAVLISALLIGFVWGWALLIRIFRRKTRNRWLILIAWICGHTALVPTGFVEVGWWVSPLNLTVCVPIFIFASIIFQRAVENRKRVALLADRVVTVQEDERRRLARELHDGAAQNLQALKLQLELREDSTISGTEREEIIRWLEMTSEEIRQSARHLHPSVLEKMSLDEAMEDYAKYLRRTGLEIQLRVDKNLNFSRLVAGNLYRIFQESVANAIHHGEASRISITLKKAKERGGIEMTISDNGIGGLAESDGLGRRSIQERADLISGTAEWIDDAGITLKIQVDQDR